MSSLLDRLNRSNFIASATQSQQEIIALFTREPVEIVFVPANARGFKLLVELRQAATNPPILIAIDLDRKAYEHSNPADLVLQLDDPNLVSNLMWCVRSHRASRRESVLTKPTSETELLKTMIVKTVSHELRTPLLQVKSAIALLADGEQDRERLLGYATEATARLENVVHNITRLAESLDTRLEPVVPIDAVNYALRHLRRSWDIREKADRIHADVSPHLLPVLADRQALGVALQLLLDNALKFSNDTVVLSVLPLDNQRIEFRVSDQGIGIPSEALERIFEPFYQIDHAATRRFGGSGVGLAIVRLILEHHGVKIQVNSHPGKGSSFAFSLPTVAGELPF